MNTKEQNNKQLEELVQFIRKQRFRFTPETINLAEEGVAQAKEVGHLNVQGVLLNYLGVFHAMQGLNYKARVYFEKAHEIYKELDDDLKVSTSFNNIGLLYYDQQKYEQALSCFFQALKYNNERLAPRTLNNIGTIYLEIKDYDKAFEYIDKALKMSYEQKIDDSVCKVLINMGTLKRHLKEYDEAVTLLNQSLAILQQKQYSTIQIDCLLELANVYQGMKKLEKAVSIYQKVIELSKESQLFKVESKAALEIGKIYKNQNQIPEAIQYSSRALGLAKEYAFTERKIDALKLMRQLYTITGKINESNALADEVIEAQQKLYEGKFKKEFEDILQDKDGEINELLNKNNIIIDQNHLLKQTNRELEKYAYIVAHDLKEPLRNITSFAQLLTRKIQQNFSDTAVYKEITGYEEFLTSNTSILQAKLNDLLQYSTIKLDPEKIEKVKVKSFLVEFLLMQKYTTADLPNILSIDGDITMYTNARHLKILFGELLDNARQFSDPKKPLEIKINAQEANGMVTISVQDNGVGIAQEYHRKIFNMFSRLTAKSPDHTGMGLAICEKIVDLYKGEIELISAEGMGSTFKVSLRSVAVSVPEEETVEEAELQES